MALFLVKHLPQPDTVSVNLPYKLKSEEEIVAIMSNLDFAWMDSGRRRLAVTALPQQLFGPCA
jgi:hypothetical protein